MKYEPLSADHRTMTQAFAARVGPEDRDFLDPLLLYQVAVASWTQATPAKRIAAIDGDDLVGLVTILPGVGWQSHVGQLRLVVQATHRGRGIGHELLAEALDLAAGLGLSKVSVEVVATNAGAIAMFEHEGFEREGTLRGHVRGGDGQDQDLAILSRFTD